MREESWHGGCYCGDSCPERMILLLVLGLVISSRRRDELSFLTDKRNVEKEERVQGFAD
jgi:hypothetical protein